MNEKSKKHFALDLVFIMLGIGLCTSIILTSKWVFSLDGDNAPQTYAVYSMVAKALYNGELPLWNPYLWGGLSNIGAPITEAFYPINWLLCLMFYNTTTELLSYAIIPANLIFHMAIYFVGMYYLLKKLSLKSYMAFMLSCLSLFSFSISNFYTWIVYIDGFCWLPLIVLTSILLLEKSKVKYFVFLGILFAMEALISVSVMLVVIVFFLFFFILFYGNVRKKGEILRRFFKLVGSGIIGILLGAPVIFSTFVYLLNGIRYVPELGWLGTMEKIPFEYFNGNNCDISSLKQLLNVMPTNSWLSIGGVLLILAIIGLFVGNHTHSKIYIWAIFGMFFSLVYSCGYILPDIIYYIPFINNLRETFMYACFFNFFVTLVAANGLIFVEEGLCSKESVFKRLSNNKLGVLLGGMAIIFMYNFVPHNLNSKSKFCYLLILLILLILILFPLKKHGYVLAVGILTLAVSINCGLYYRSFSVGNYSESEAVMKIEETNLNTKLVVEELLKNGDGRIAYLGNGCYPQNSSGVIGFRDVIGYFNPLPKYAQMVHEKVSLDKRAQLQNIKYYLVSETNSQELMTWLNDSFAGWTKEETLLEMFQNYDAVEKTGVYVYNTNNTLGDAWLVGDYVNADNDEEMINWINASSTDLSKVTCLNEEDLSESVKDSLKDMNSSVTGSVTKILESGNKVKYKINSNEKGILVTSNLYYPGWKVYVNGKKSEVLRVNCFHQGVVLPDGESEVEFVFRPFAVSLGIVLQILGIIAIFIMIMNEKSRCTEIRLIESHDEQEN